MNERIIKLGLNSGMLNYVDHETPRHYFLCGNADEECLEKFAELIVQGCIGQAAAVGCTNSENEDILWASEVIIENIKNHFGVEE